MGCNRNWGTAPSRSSGLPCARQECPAGWWWLSFALYLSSASGHLVLPHSPKVFRAQFCSCFGRWLWDISLAWSTPWVACLLFVAEDRHKPAEIPICCTPAHLWLCSMAGEVLAVLHTGATWTALPRTGCGTWVSCSGAVHASVSGLETLSTTSSPSVAQSKANLGSSGSSGESQRGQWHTQMSIFYFMGNKFHCISVHSK